MAFLTYADRVAETTTTTGTGTIQLAGAVDAKFRTFVAGVGSGATVPYVVVHRTANEWEVGYGVVTAGSPNTLTRAGIYSSSNSNNAVNLSTGTKDVFLSLPGSKTVRFDDATGGLAVDGTTLVVDATNDRVGIGTASPGVLLDVAGTSRATFVTASTTGTQYAGFNSTNANGGYLTFESSSTVHGDIGTAAQIVSGGANTDFAINARGSRNLVLGTNNTERARITSGGYLKASDDGTYNSTTGVYHELRGSGTAPALLVENTNAAPLGQQVNFVSASPNNTTAYFLACSDSVNVRAYIWSNGDLANTNGVYGTISDEKLKQDIVDANSQWDDVKAIRFRKYRFKTDVAADADAPFLLGVVAQEIEQTCPNLVDEHPDMEQVEVEVEVTKTRPVLNADGEPMRDEDGTALTEEYTETETRTEQRPTGTFTKSVKSSILLMKAAVALQEAMTRIEALETRLAALEGE
jgi:hypothetical protein